MSDRLAGSLNSPQILRHTLNDCFWPKIAMGERPFFGRKPPVGEVSFCESRPVLAHVLLNR